MTTVELFKNNIFIPHPNFPDVVAGEVDIPSDYVSMTFAPILGQHLAIPGTDLQNGMIVVLADSLRANPNDLSPENEKRKDGYIPSEYTRRSVEETARWCLVTKLQIQGQIVSFVGIYADGTQRKRAYNAEGFIWGVIAEDSIHWICANCGEEVHEIEMGDLASSDFPTKLEKALDLALGDFFKILDPITPGSIQDLFKSFDKKKVDDTIKDMEDNDPDKGTFVTTPTDGPDDAPDYEAVLSENTVADVLQKANIPAHAQDAILNSLFHSLDIVDDESQANYDDTLPPGGLSGIFTNDKIEDIDPRD